MSRFDEGRLEEMIKFSEDVTRTIDIFLLKTTYPTLRNQLKKRYRGVDEERLKEWV